MKINLLFHYNSVTKVISNSCILILIISALHILCALSSFDSYISDSKSISGLNHLKLETIKLLYVTRYQPQDLTQMLITIEAEQNPEKLLTSSWFNTQTINTENAELLTDWEKIKSQISRQDYEQLENTLQQFSLSIDSIITQFQTLSAQKIDIVRFSELIEFILIALAGAALFYYSKKQISQPIQQLVSNVKSIKANNFDLHFPDSKNEIGVLSQGMGRMSKKLQILIEDMKNQVDQKTEALEKANQTIEFLYLISQQLSTVKLTSPILFEALNALAKHANLKKLCLELNNGTFVTSSLGCASLDATKLRIPIVINGKPYGYLNYVQSEDSIDCTSLIESFSGLVARALYQEEYSLQAQKILLMEERGVIARELHDSIAQSLSFLKIQCAVLHRQVNEEKQSEAKQSICNIESAVADSYIQLRSLLSTFRLSVSESNFKDAITTMITSLQMQTTALITMKQFETNFHTDASQHIHLLQIIREAIINAIKHAQCKKIDVSCIITDENRGWISIIDDGLGFTEKSDEEMENHYGLSIMKQRADELNATLTLTRLHQGTEVKLIFPYTEQLNQGIQDV